MQCHKFFASFIFLIVLIVLMIYWTLSEYLFSPTNWLWSAKFIYTTFILNYFWKRLLIFDLLGRGFFFLTPIFWSILVTGRFFTFSKRLQYAPNLSINGIKMWKMFVKSHRSVSGASSLSGGTVPDQCGGPVSGPQF